MEQVIMGAIFVVIVLGIYIAKRFNEYVQYRSKVFLMCQEWNTQHFNQIVVGETENAYEWCYNTLPDFKSVIFHNKELTHQLMLEVDAQKKLGLDVPLHLWSKEDLHKKLQEVVKDDDYETASQIRDLLRDKT